LPEESFRRIQPLLRQVSLKSSEVLYESRAIVEQVYFPIDCVTSDVMVMQSGAMIEVATVGNEGALGMPALARTTISPHRVFIQIAGNALRADAEAFNARARADEVIWDMLSRYHHAFLFQISQSVACNGLHVVKPRCCRWLLMTHDRVAGDEVALTHEFLSFMLGVRRASVTVVLNELQEEGLIHSERGKIRIIDRAGLEQASCECYRAVANEHQRLLGE
jgi:CRP-like cAMP-binding protein